MKLTIKQVNESLKLFGMQAQRDSKTEVSVKQAGETIYSASSLQEVVGFYNGVQFTKLCAAQALGRLARGIPKIYSPSELDTRAKRLKEARAKRWAGHKKKAS